MKYRKRYSSYFTTESIKSLVLNLLAIIMQLVAFVINMALNLPLRCAEFF